MSNDRCQRRTDKARRPWCGEDGHVANWSGGPVQFVWSGRSIHEAGLNASELVDARLDKLVNNTARHVPDGRRDHQSCRVDGCHSLRGDQPVAHQTSIDQRPRQHRHYTYQTKLMTQRSRSRTRMHTTQSQQLRLHFRGHLMRTRIRLRRHISQTGQPASSAPFQPGVHHLA